MVEGVKEGRLIFANLRKVIGYQIAAGCWSELIPVLATFFLGMPQPLSSFLMIIISCITDVAAGVALTNEIPEKTIMTEPPRDPKAQPLVDMRLVGYAYLFYGTLESIASFVVRCCCCCVVVMWCCDDWDDSVIVGGGNCCCCCCCCSHERNDLSIRSHYINPRNVFCL